MCIRDTVAILMLSIPLALACGACTTKRLEIESEGLDSPNPATRLRAIRDAAGSDDPAVIPDLIEALESDDPAVRFMTIETLHRLTGETYGYDYAALPPKRIQAVDRWQAAWEAGEVGVIDRKPDEKFKGNGQREMTQSR